MEVDFIDFIAMGVVVLDQPLASDIPDLYCSVATSTCNASAIGVEPYRVDLLIMITKLYNLLPRGEIPELDSFIIRGRSQHSDIWGELAGPDKVIVRMLQIKGLLVIIRVEDL